MPSVPETIDQITDPRQLKAIALWRNPKSDTFGNLRASAMSAGYSEKYADNLTALKPAWLAVSAQKDVAMISKAQKNMDQDLNIEVNIDGKWNVDKARLRFEVSKFILKTLARSKYTEDEEVAPPNVQINLINYSKDPSTLAVVRDVEATEPRL